MITSNRNRRCGCIIVLPHGAQQNQARLRGMCVGLAWGPHSGLEVLLDRQVREAARVLLRIHHEQIATCVKDEVKVDINRPDVVALGILAHGGDELLRTKRPNRTHDPLDGALRHHWRASRLTAYRVVQLVVGLPQGARKSTESLSNVALPLKFEQLAKLQRRPLEPTKE